MIDLSGMTDADARASINSRKPYRYMATAGDGRTYCSQSDQGPFTPCELQMTRMPDGSVRQMFLRVEPTRN